MLFSHAQLLFPDAWSQALMLIARGQPALVGRPTLGVGPVGALAGVPLVVL